MKRRFYIVAFPSLIDSKITSSIIVMATHNSAIRIGKLMRRHWSWRVVHFFSSTSSSHSLNAPHQKISLSLTLRSPHLQWTRRSRELLSFFKPVAKKKRNIKGKRQKEEGKVNGRECWKGNFLFYLEVRRDGWRWENLPTGGEREGGGGKRQGKNRERQLMREEEGEEPCFCFRGHFFHFN